jgi:hypothetical protein
VIRQAALYLVSADDIQAARLPVAGRPAAFRAIVSAVRAGARRVAVPPVLRSPDLETALARSPSARAALVWLDDASALTAEPTLLLPAAALAPAAVLTRMLQAPPGQVLAESHVAGAPILTADAALLASVHSDLVKGAPLGAVLIREAGARATGAMRGDRWFVRVTDTRGAAEADTRLWGELGSVIDTRLDTAVHRRLSKYVTRVAVALGIPPNAITVGSGVVGLGAAALMARGDVGPLVGGLLLYLAAVVLDHSDGEVARLTLTESAIGEWLDIVVDTIVHTALALALGLAAQHVSGGGLGAGIVAAVGVIASAVVGKRWPPTPAAATARGPLDGLLDGLTSRDGFYAMLIVFIVVRALAPAGLPVLMLVVAVGTHAYWVARAALSIRPGRGGGKRP